MAVRKRYLLLAAVVAVVMIVAAIILLAILVLATMAYVSAAPPIEFSLKDSQSTRIEKAEAWQERLFDNQSFNGAILVIKDGEVLISKCSGYTDPTKDLKLTPQTSMRLASVSKQFTAAAILVLVQQERIGLDDLVSSHLEDFPYGDVTVRHLLNMTSGIPDCYMELAESHKGDVDECLKISDVTNLIAKYPPAREGSVNEFHSYSNTSYVLLAAIVESVSNSSMEDFMARELFGPLGMKNSRIWNLVSEDSSFEGQAKSFFASQVEVPGFLDGVAGDGAVFCSLDDFVLWDQFWRGNDLVSPELMKQAFERPTLADGSLSDYGFGWVIEGDGHWHNGAWLGARSYTYQDEDFFVVIVDNSSSLIVDSMGSELRRILDD